MTRLIAALFADLLAVTANRVFLTGIIAPPDPNATLTNSAVATATSKTTATSTQDPTTTLAGTATVTGAPTSTGTSTPIGTSPRRPAQQLVHRQKPRQR